MTVKATPKKKRAKAGGRKKGTPNKTTGAIKEAIFEAFQKAGGVNYLVKLSETDPRSFTTLLGKIIPTEIKAEINVHTELTSRLQSGRQRVIDHDDGLKVVNGGKK